MVFALMFGLAFIGRLRVALAASQPCLTLPWLLLTTLALLLRWADVFTLGLIAGFGAGALVALLWAAMVPPPKRRAL